MPQKVASRYTGSPWQVCMASRAILRSKGQDVNGVRGNEWMRPSAVSLAPHRTTSTDEFAADAVWL